MKDLLLFSKAFWFNVFWLYILFTVHFLTLFVYLHVVDVDVMNLIALKKHVPCPSIPIFLCRPTVFCSTCWSRGTSEHSPYKPDLPLPLRIGTFRGYWILFSIWNSYISINSPIVFLFIHNHFTLRKWCCTRLLHDFPLDPLISPFHFHFRTYKRELT